MNLRELSKQRVRKCIDIMKMPMDQLEALLLEHTGKKTVDSLTEEELNKIDAIFFKLTFQTIRDRALKRKAAEEELHEPYWQN